MCKYCDGNEDELSTKTLFDKRIKLCALDPDTFIQQWIIPEKKELITVLFSGVGKEKVLTKSKIKYCPMCGREL